MYDKYYRRVKFLAMLVCILLTIMAPETQKGLKLVNANILQLSKYSSVLQSRHVWNRYKLMNTSIHNSF